jgi:hypothetical protein
MLYGMKVVVVVRFHRPVSIPKRNDALLTCGT